MALASHVGQPRRANTSSRTTIAIMNLISIEEHLVFSGAKASYDTSDVHWNYEEPFSYDGTEKSIALEGVPTSINVRYRDNRALAAGTYTAKAYLTYDNDNYEEPDIETTIEWEIK